MGKVIPEKVFFTKGVGKHREKLESFELALRDAGIEKFNIVRVSSILPPKCEIISRENGLKELMPGQVLFCVLSENASSSEQTSLRFPKPNQLIVASIGCAIPADKEQYGYLSEHHSYGESDAKAGEYAEDLAASMLATTLGIEFDVEKNYDERKEVWKMSG
ncbi:MAG: arginine decarboxylase, pyruvoyl-dependent, partial [Candidatus Hydrothermarchaeota archaeon]|nr:arginine decarboxylase, pyruvoyl-dependent [Candidatus Hydrothermarchaeota archaeon]